jgi:hypothetical protein
MRSGHNHIILLLLLLLVLGLSCNMQEKGTDEIDAFTAYFLASKENPEHKWEYTADTVNIWFDDKKGAPSQRIKGQKTSGKWQAWDEEMHSSSRYDSLWYDPSEHAVKGFFYENNDFYKLLGKSPTKTLRTYWFNRVNKIHKILIYWIPEENTTTSEHLKPVVEWALKVDSLEISELYPDGRIVPTRENAVRWKALLTQYNERH